jgi:hypothetical protein
MRRISPASRPSDIGALSKRLVAIKELMLEAGKLKDPGFVHKARGLLAQALDPFVAYPHPERVEFRAALRVPGAARNEAIPGDFTVRSRPGRKPRENLVAGARVGVRTPLNLLTWKCANSPGCGRFSQRRALVELLAGARIGNQLQRSLARAGAPAHRSKTPTATISPVDTPVTTKRYERQQLVGNDLC